MQKSRWHISEESMILRDGYHYCRLEFLSRDQYSHNQDSKANWKASASGFAPKCRSVDQQRISYPRKSFESISMKFCSAERSRGDVHTRQVDGASLCSQ